jgi:hypothetical protein
LACATAKSFQGTVAAFDPGSLKPVKHIEA